MEFEGPVYTKQDDYVFFEQIHGDGRRYLQILVNFVNNAVKFSKPGGKVSVIAEVKNLRSVKMPYKDRPNQTIVETLAESNSSFSSAPDKDIDHEDEDDQDEQFEGAARPRQ